MEVQVSPTLYNGGYHISCHGGNNGKINSLVIGGTPPITYSWSNGATTQLIEQLVTGTYTVTVTQSGGSTATASVALREPGVLDPSLYSALYPGGTNISLYGGQDGSIQVTDQGGTPPYEYLWSNSSMEQNQYELGAATYTVTVTDANACTTTGSITLTQPAPLTISSITSPTFNGYNVPCFGGYGSINLTLTGGVPPYEILWNNGSFDEDPTELRGGDYSVRVIDQNNNQVEASLTLTEPDALSLQLAPFVFANNYHISLFGGYDGSINTNTGGGVTPYTFLWNDGSTLQNHTTLNHGLKAVTLTDANGCTVAAEILLLEPASADWMMNGNANTNPATQYIGTSDNTDLLFKTNNIERLKVKADGELVFNKAVADTIKINRLMPILPDSLIRLGLHSIIINGKSNLISFDPSLSNFNNIYGLGIGNSNNINYSTWGPVGIGLNAIALGSGTSRAYGDYSLTLGTDLRTSSISQKSIVIGSGPSTGNPATSYFMFNKPNALGITFNSNQSTLFVGPGNGLWTYGTVGIATEEIPAGYRFAINGSTTIGTFANYPATTANSLLVEGNIGIGTSLPTEKLEINGNAKISALASIDNSIVTASANGTLGITPLGVAGLGLWQLNGNNISNANNGFIGLGTTTPLDRFQTNEGTNKLCIGSANNLSAGTAYIGFNAARTTSGWVMHSDGWHNGGSVIYSNIVGSLYFATNPALDPLAVNQNLPDAQIEANTRLFIHGEGNIGIGTVQPAALLHARGNNPVFMLEDNSYTTDNAVGTLSIINGAGVSWFNSSGGVCVMINPTVNNDFNFCIGKPLGGGAIGELFRVNKDGVASARAMKVTLGLFPDYVFDKQYDLKPLEEIKSFTDKHHHLPGIPSSNEIITNGLDLGQMQSMQMEKIENIYLYLIQLQKENVDLKKRIGILENK